MDADYSLYENRLDSFSDWPKESPAYVKDLAEAGFYFCKEFDFASCFECKIKLGDWTEGDEPLKRHELVKPSCKYLAERIKRKVYFGSSSAHSPISKPTNETHVFTGFCHPDNRQKSIKDFRSSISDEKAKIISGAGLFYNDSARLFECFNCHTQFDPIDVLSCDDPTILHTEINPACKHISTIFLEKRLESTLVFPSSISDEKAKTISDAGLFYIDSDNMFECYSCCTQFNPVDVLSCDNPTILHTEINPACKHLSTIFLKKNSGSMPVPGPDHEASSRSKKDLEFPTPVVNVDLQHVTTSLKIGNNLPKEKSVRITETRTKLTNTPRNLKIKMPQPKEFNDPGQDFRSPVNRSTTSSAGTPPGICQTSPRHTPPVSSPSRVSPSTYTLIRPPSISYNRQPSFGRQESNLSNASDEDLMSIRITSQRPSNALETTSSQSELKSKYYRLNTFLTWPQNSMIQPRELSEAGFYYMLHDDAVKCYRCNVALRNWEVGDTAWGEHKKWSPHCPLVLEQDSQRNSLQYNSNEFDSRYSITQGHDVYQRQYVGEQKRPNMTSPTFRFATAPSSNTTYSPNLNQTNYVRFLGEGTHVIGTNNVLYYPNLANRPNSVYSQREQFVPFDTYDNFDNQHDHNEQDQEGAIGPLSEDAISNLQDAGFSIELINEVQRLGLEKYNCYFDSVEAVADAIVYFQENGDLEEHSIPEKDSETTETSENHMGMQSDNSEGHVDLKRELDKEKEKQLCKICMDESVGVAFLPCGHALSCPNCSVGMKQCPLCRAAITSSSRIYLS